VVQFSKFIDVYEAEMGTLSIAWQALLKLSKNSVEGVGSLLIY